MSWDHHILLFAAAHRSEGLDSVFRTITWLGSLYLLAPLAILMMTLLLHRNKRSDALLLAVGFGGAILLVRWVKVLANRPRPALMQPLVAMPTDSSFPSAHTLQIAAFALCALLIIRRIWPEWQFAAAALAVLLIVGVGASRIYLQVHFPSDVLGGIAIGIAWVVLAHKLL